MLNQLAYLYQTKQTDQAIKLADSAYTLAQKLNYPVGIAWALEKKAGAYWMQGNYPITLKYALEALEIFESLNHTEGIAQTYNTIANTYNMKGEHVKSLEYYEKSVDKYKALNDTYNLHRANANIGRTHYMLGNYKEARKYLDMVINAYQEDQQNILYPIVKNTEGDVLQAQGQLNEALNSYFIALSLAEALGNPRIITYSTRGISEVYQQQGKLAESNNYASKTLKLAQEIGYLENVKNAALILSDNYSQQGIPDKAYDFYKLHDQVQDSMFNIEKENAIRQLQQSYEIEQKQKEIELLKAEQLIQQQANKNQRLILYLLIIVSVFIGLMVIILFRSNREKQKTNKMLSLQGKQLAEQNAEILQQREELITQSKKLEEANHIKDRLFSVISHDLRSPFNSLLSIIENIDKISYSENEFKMLKESIYTEILALSEMLNSLLDWSHMQMKGNTTEKVPVELHETVDRNLQVFETMAREKGIALKKAFKGNFTAFADKDQVDSIFRNLINNALKFTSKNGEVIVGVKDFEQDALLISIKDTGTGMSEYTASNILKEGGNITTLGTNHEVGKGLGLQLCKDFVNNNNGEIWVESEEGKGTTFYFTLPKAD